ncbi:hypothetical protein [Thioflexithrix psekupsensis]|uniref:4-vinyl reductase 4VR domain-containing protein n=1 Tax=Thioflexithrix psekupsensis TaxID=1570016 RepID=A0A251X9J6_9GAMM|nr:hypothetical protein [Thioflexithrix psekupsensis]OUD14172.1 hypothetical protein TPSD3_07520 [Thioflexithrix psekupsensis]
MTTVATRATPSIDAALLSGLNINGLFEPAAYRFDLREGTVRAPTEVRLIYLSTDIIRGIYEALHYEAGEAWHVILKNAGYLWGKRLALSLEQEVKIMGLPPLVQMPVEQYIFLIEQYFNRHGWGVMQILLDDAPRYGIVRAVMTHSLFASALNHVEDRVDAMIAGMLRGVFESISGQELDCIEIVCARQSAAPACQFLISSQERILNIEPLVEDGVAAEAIVEQLRQL